MRNIFFLLLLIAFNKTLQSSDISSKLYISPNFILNTTNFIESYSNLEIGVYKRNENIGFFGGFGIGIPIEGKNKDFKNYEQQTRRVNNIYLGVNRYFNISSDTDFILGLKYNFINFYNGDIYIENEKSIRSNDNNIFHVIEFNTGFKVDRFEVTVFYNISVNKVKPYQNISNEYRLNTFGLGIKTYIF